MNIKRYAVGSYETGWWAKDLTRPGLVVFDDGQGNGFADAQSALQACIAAGPEWDRVTAKVTFKASVSDLRRAWAEYHAAQTVGQLPRCEYRVGETSEILAKMKALYGAAQETNASQTCEKAEFGAPPSLAFSALFLIGTVIGAGLCAGLGIWFLR